jgi:hypothetical protein
MIKLYALDSYMAMNRTKLIPDTKIVEHQVKSAKPREPRKQQQRIYINNQPVPAKHDLDSRHQSLIEDNSPLSQQVNKILEFD